ncbi:MAG: hypothetical protein U9P90_01625 [Patescibacteria group bacterium]|nr:hypothetical protein [Patescibacteria group bacterium]
MEEEIKTSRFIAAIGYLWILCLVPLILRKKDKFAQFHGKQGLLLAVIWFFGGLIFWIPVFGWLIALGLAFVSIYGFFQAIKGEKWEIPILGKYAKKINL